ncbi:MULTISPECIES: flagellar basal body rod protein FlgC [Marinobacter]|uniref:Flagellar basal-body rod protein FlgC n=1 Tax=Marinobacter xestospongiae TaxID=994319 RepID=A0ABU3VWI3_9GAMM|nr:MULTISPECIES: flagellar basal body rod protein FlgC [Marinobacter]MCG8517629.1 flagellar basal body rod protein FlgC [Pseudomonadales bacterium]MCK7567352.1 flagellar basal body rod protein FlgC [Marinobacter xestospongiae]MDV2078637.1 flagellar basal body rod protein FlgC [Marinobacter xestospongiae]UDL05532.1 flagellar basal body rod protein FlgC [Marinobacter sp. CA1]
MAFHNIYDIAGSAMRAQSVRLNTVASNLANANSAAGSEEDAFRAIKPVFASLYQSLETRSPVTSQRLAAASVGIAGVTESDRAIERRHEPGSPIADGDGYVYYSNVNVVEEMADMMSASRNFQTSVDMVSRVNSMQQGLLRLGQS